MARIYKLLHPAPSANKAAHPVVNTKANTPASIKGKTAGISDASADVSKSKNEPKKDESE